jgi:hypothetical protein
VAGIDGLTVATTAYEAACRRMAIGHNWPRWKQRPHNDLPDAILSSANCPGLSQRSTANLCVP